MSTNRRPFEPAIRRGLTAVVLGFADNGHEYPRCALLFQDYLRGIAKAWLVKVSFGWRGWSLSGLGRKLLLPACWVRTRQGGAAPRWRTVRPPARRLPGSAPMPRESRRRRAQDVGSGTRPRRRAGSSAPVAHWAAYNRPCGPRRPRGRERERRPPGRVKYPFPREWHGKAPAGSRRQPPRSPGPAPGMPRWQPNGISALSADISPGKSAPAG